MSRRAAGGGGPPINEPVKAHERHRNGARQRHVNSRRAANRDEVIRGRQHYRCDNRAGAETFTPQKRVHQQHCNQRTERCREPRNPRRYVPAVQPPDPSDQPVIAWRFLQIGLTVEERGQAPFARIEHPLRVLRCPGLVTAHQVALAKLEEEQKDERKKRCERNKTGQ
jgi:hypothetical protein